MGGPAAANRILLVESIGLRAPSASRDGRRKVAARLKGARQGLRRTQEGIWLLSPLVLPAHGWGWARGLNRRLLRATLRRALRRLSMKRPILWIFLPTGADLVGELDERLVIYHCVDAYAENPGVDREAIAALETRILKDCDLFLATSKPLFEDKRGQAAGRALLVGNVAAVGPCAAAAGWTIRPGGPADPAVSGPVSAVSRVSTGPRPELTRIPRPILGYTGNLADYKLDLDLLRMVAVEHPEWSFCLICPHGAGDPATDLAPLAALENVHQLGPRPHATPPAYVAAFAV